MRLLSLATVCGFLTAAAYALDPNTPQDPVQPDTPVDSVSDDSESFFRRLEGIALEQRPPTELWPLFERCGRELAEAAQDDPLDPATPDVESARAVWMRQYRCALIARELAARGETTDREALWRAFDDPEANAELRQGIVRGMLDRRLEEAAAESTDAPGATATTAVDPLLLRVPARHAAFVRSLEESESSRFGDLPDDLRDVWRTVSSATGAYLRLGLSLGGDEPSSYIADSPGFFLEVSEYLRGRVSAAEALRRIGRYEWGSWCGTGAGAFHEPRDRAMLLALVELGRNDLAAGALLAVASDEWAPARPGAEDDRRPPPWHRLAGRLGHDWESLAIGSLLLGDRRRGMEVAEHGSERGARLLLGAVEQPAPDDRGARVGDDDTSLAALAALVARADGCDGYASSSLDGSRLAGELPADVQLEALAAIASRATDRAGLELASEAARQLHRLCRAESLHAFEAMSRSRFAAVRAEAAKARRALTGDELQLVAAPPVAFLVRVDGTPWRGRVEWTTTRVGMTTSETRPLDAEGRLSLDRDMFVDPKAPVRSVSVQAASLEGAADTWFVAQVPAPRKLSAVTEIAVETQRLTLLLPGPHAGLCGDAGCRVRLEAETPLAIPGSAEDDADAEDGYFEEIAEERPLRADQAWSVRVVRGLRYRAVVEAGDASWTSPEVEVDTRPVTLSLRGDRLLSIREQVEALVEEAR